MNTNFSFTNQTTNNMKNILTLLLFICAASLQAQPSQQDSTKPATSSVLESPKTYAQPDTVYVVHRTEPQKITNEMSMSEGTQTLLIISMIASVLLLLVTFAL